MVAQWFPSIRHPHFVRLIYFLFKQNPNSNLQFQALRVFSSGSSWLCQLDEPIKIPHQQFAKPQASLLSQPEPILNPNSNPNPDFSQNDFITISDIFTNCSISSGPSLHEALDRTGIKPSSNLLQLVFSHFESSPKLLYSLFLWAQKQPDFQPPSTLFNYIVNVLGKSREFDSAWSLILDQINKVEGSTVVTGDTFVTMIRWYARADMPQSAIRTFEFANSSSGVLNSGSEKSLFEMLLDSLCKKGHVDIASAYFYRKREVKSNWVPSVQVYNILLNGWFRSGNLKHAEQLWLEMKKDEVTPSMVTYWTLVEGYCCMHCVEKAIELVSELRMQGIEPNAIIYNPIIDALAKAGRLEQLWLEMKKDEITPSMVTYRTLVECYCCMHCVEKAIELVSELRMQGIEPNATIYNPIIDALAKAGRFKEALGMMERFLILESGPTISTYNSLVKGFCKAANLEGASKMLKDMISRGIVPTPTTYNYFFRYFMKFGKIDEGMNLYGKMIESGYVPDRLTYYLLLKMFCKEKRIALAFQVREEMRIRGIDMNLAMSTKLIHLLCDMHKFKDAIAEFENMIKRGIVPHYLTFQKMFNDLKESGRTKMAQKLCAMMSSVPYSMKLPFSYNSAASRARRNSIIQKAKGLSDLLKTSKDPRKLIKSRSLFTSAVSSANRLVEDVKKKN